MSQQGKVIDNRFELGQVLGVGGMGTVFKGIDRLTDEPVAIKLLKPEVMDNNPLMVERFIREAEALRALNHPNIVKVLATVYEEGNYYMVLEYVGGGDLNNLLKREGKLPIRRALEMTLDLSDALTRAHRLKIIHRDIKPANVLIADDDSPRLTDFGVARMLRMEGLTESGVAIGTLEYLAPEALGGNRVDERADIWALGVMLYEMVTGNRPFSGQTAHEIVTSISLSPMPDIHETRRDSPFELTDLIQRMLVKNPAERIHTIRQVGLELEAIIQEVETVSPRSQSMVVAKPEVLANADTNIVAPAAAQEPVAITEILPPPFEWCEVEPGFVFLSDESRQNPPGTQGGRYKILGFEIAKYPITNAQYHAFVDSDDGYRDKQWWGYSDAARKWRESNPKPRQSTFQGDNLPRTDVTWYEATAFCYWLSAKSQQEIALPTEQQWQLAAQGGDNRTFPWGNEFEEDRGNFRSRGTTPVTRFENGASPFGVMDMCGNVLEWCSTNWGTGEHRVDVGNRRVLRGGSWYRGPVDELKVTFRVWNHPDFRSDNRGFRIVRLS